MKDKWIGFELIDLVIFWWRYSSTHTHADAIGTWGYHIRHMHLSQCIMSLLCLRFSFTLILIFFAMLFIGTINFVPICSLGAYDRYSFDIRQTKGRRLHPFFSEPSLILICRSDEESTWSRFHHERGRKISVSSLILFR